MISFDNFKMQEGTPLYLQILIYIKRGVVAGVISHGDELPSRRVLSVLLLLALMMSAQSLLFWQSMKGYNAELIRNVVPIIMILWQ